jgi:transcriptional regulator with XRE-family HTH domain
MVIRIGHEPDPAKRIRQHQGATLRKLRTYKGMSIEDFAEQVGVTPGAVSQWETGRFSPRQPKQLEIAKALDVPHSTIFGLDAEVAAS